MPSPALLGVRVNVGEDGQVVEVKGVKGARANVVTGRAEDVRVEGGVVDVDHRVAQVLHEVRRAGGQLVQVRSGENNVRNTGGRLRRRTVAGVAARQLLLTARIVQATVVVVVAITTSSRRGHLRQLAAGKVEATAFTGEGDVD